jgi:hypothetical protein
MSIFSIVFFHEMGSKKEVLNGIHVSTGLQEKRDALRRSGNAEPPPLWRTQAGPSASDVLFVFTCGQKQCGTFFVVTNYFNKTQ